MLPERANKSLYINNHVSRQKPEKNRQEKREDGEVEMEDYFSYACC